MSHLHCELRSGVFQFRRRIPLDLLPVYGGKKEIRHSLRTRDRAEASRRARARSVELDEEFAHRRVLAGQGAAILPVLTELDLSDSNIHGICQRWKRAILESDDDNRMNGFQDKSYEDVSEVLSDVEQPLRMALAKGEMDYTDIQEAVHDALTGHSGGGVGRKYGAKKYPLKPLVRAIRMLEYPGIQLPVIEP